MNTPAVLPSPCCGSAIDRDWVHAAIQKLNHHDHRSADTHLLRLDVPAWPGITVYLKDESTHPTGSLKHRLGRALFLYGLCNGWIGPDTTIVEASSGSTAVSEAYFARLLGLRFIAVMPRTIAEEKTTQIRLFGGECHLVDDPATVYEVAQRLADELGGRYMDQFTYAERATDWRANNIAESIFSQMQGEPHPVPTWIVCGAGTGGTSATIGRYLRFRRFDSRLCLADPEASVFHRHVHDRTIVGLNEPGSLIEGIGRARVEPSFVPELIDRTECVSDVESIAAARVISKKFGRLCGGSTGTNMQAVARLAREMASGGQAGSIVTLLCDSGERYRSTYFNDEWIATQGLDLTEHEAKLNEELAGSTF